MANISYYLCLNLGAHLLLLYLRHYAVFFNACSMYWIRKRNKFDSTHSYNYISHMINECM